ncbi:MAG: urea ABC transporter ATP-binding subunit UrtE [Desulfovibrionaceae bacterium]|nr:urea ABC transporter ATP-binding subunit UrtE [Desulfovibrionaceae bacterium]MBF0513403.1 urea ABC transporter ATP-binding subunit UrtE [Desulfovibrionaceae bacterium]
MLEVSGLNQFYGGSHTLWDVGFTVPRGSCACIMGRNGVGKTTLLKAIMGLVQIKSGAIVFSGRDLAGKNPALRARNGIGYVPQGREIFPRLSVEENLRVGLIGRRDKSRIIPEIIFELFPALREMLSRQGGDLSGGQQQQLAIGRALAVEPELLVLDEPTEGIQPNIVQEIGDIIKRLNTERGMTVLLVEQKLLFARKVAGFFHLMDKGRLVASGAMADLGDELIDRHLTV